MKDDKQRKQRQLDFLLNHLGMSWSEVCRALQVELRTVHRWITGDSRPTGAPAVLLDAIWDVGREIQKSEYPELRARLARGLFTLARDALGADLKRTKHRR